MEPTLLPAGAPGLNLYSFVVSLLRLRKSTEDTEDSQPINLPVIMALVLRECVPLPEIISLIGTCKVDSTLSTRGYVLTFLRTLACDILAKPR